MGEKCEHENCEELVSFDHGWRGAKDRHCYQVGICLDCGQVFNWASGNDEQTTKMKPLEIVQMFVDLHDVIQSHVDEIQSQAKSLYEAADGMIDRMPKPKGKQ